MISKLHYITQETESKTHWQLAEEACACGVDWVQLRVKGMPEDTWKDIAVKTQNICVKYGTKFIINDNVLLAQKILADGVHLGKNNMNPEDARKILGEHFLIGGTANTFEDILILADAGVDYIGLGPFRFTKTKDQLSPVLGITGYKKILQQCTDHKINIPVIAIGGILPDDVAELMNTGIYGIAVSSAINNSLKKTETIHKFRHLIEM
ncbi:MAG: thiamine phosphate synthase [Bacteroidia bacterium]|nr:thiamine phosphate synthase [Bacteroidia bacterium]